MSQNIERWVQEQLKKGYTKEEIKKFLISAGYSPQTVNKLLSKFNSSSETKFMRGNKEFLCHGIRTKSMQFADV